MLPSKNCIDLVKYFEGLGDGDTKTPGLQPYMDPVGIWTIGYGKVLTQGGRQLVGPRDGPIAREIYPNGITEEQAEAMLVEELNSIAEKLKANNVFGTQGQIDAFVCMAYNIGVGQATGLRPTGFLGSTLLKLHRNGGVVSDYLDRYLLVKFAAASRNKQITSIGTAFTAWSYSGKKWFLGLFRRRAAEYALYRGHTAEQAINWVKDFRP